MATEIKTSPEFALGDRVQVKNYSGPPGKIIELRGPLGPKGANIYRVAIPMEPGFPQIEVRSDQLERITTLTKKFAGQSSIGVQKAIREVKQASLSDGHRLVPEKRSKKLNVGFKSLKQTKT